MVRAVSDRLRIVPVMCVIVVNGELICADLGLDSFAKLSPRFKPPFFVDRKRRGRIIREEWWFEPWAQFSKRIQTQISAYKLAVDDYHAHHGYDPEAVGNSPHHFEWLALFQVGRQSPIKIRDWHEKTHGEQLAESAITKGYTRLAKRIGLMLRTKYP